MKNFYLCAFAILAACSAPSTKGISNALTDPIKNQKIIVSNNPDIDYLKNMIPHHQGAVDASSKYLESSTNVILKSIVEVIKTFQENTVLEFRDLITKYENNSPDYSSIYTKQHQDQLFKIIDDMKKNKFSVKLTGDMEVDYINSVINHHQGSVDLSKFILSITKNEEISNKASALVLVQESEIQTFATFLEVLKISSQIGSSNNVQIITQTNE